MVSLLQPGDQGPMLDYYASELARLGISREVIFKDMIDVLKYRDVFTEEVRCLYHEIAYGDYLKYRFSKSGGIDIAARTTEDLAIVCRHACRAMYRVLSGNGLYDQDGIFPYDYIDYQRGMFYLRGLR